MNKTTSQVIEDARFTLSQPMRKGLLTKARIKVLKQYVRSHSAKYKYHNQELADLLQYTTPNATVVVSAFISSAVNKGIVKKTRIGNGFRLTVYPGSYKKKPTTVKARVRVNSKKPLEVDARDTYKLPYLPETKKSNETIFILKHDGTTIADITFRDMSSEDVAKAIVSFI